MTGPDTNPKPDSPRPTEAAETTRGDVYPLHAAVMREMADPTDGFEPTPVWLMLLYFVIAGAAGWYLATYGGGFRPDIYDERPAARYAGAVAAKKSPPDQMAQGKRIFVYCVQCHQENGQGIPGIYPPLAGSEWVNGPQEVLARILLHGLQGGLSVKGVTFNGEMPAWAETLKDEQIASVLTYLRASWGNEAPAVTPESVSAIRRETKGRTKPWTEAELKALAGTTSAKESVQ